MRNLRLWATAAVASTLVLVPATAASAHGTRSGDLRDRAVFVQLNGGAVSYTHLTLPTILRV